MHGIGTLGIHAGVYFAGEYTVEDIMLRGDRLPEHPDDETDLTAERVERCIWLSTVPVLLLNRFVENTGFELDTSYAVESLLLSLKVL